MVLKHSLNKSVNVTNKLKITILKGTSRLLHNNSYRFSCGLTTW